MFNLHQTSGAHHTILVYTTAVSTISIYTRYEYIIPGVKLMKAGSYSIALLLVCK